MVNDPSPSQTSSPSKPVRVSLNTNTQKLVLQDLNRLFEAAGLPSRNLDKLSIALKHSLFCVSAKTLKTKKLVGFVRATGDGVFNTTVWDLIVDPTLPNQDGLKMLLMSRLRQEVKKTIPNCAISMLANTQDLEVLERMDFSEDERGIRAMALVHESLLDP